MNDYEKLKELLISFNITFKEKDDEECLIIRIKNNGKSMNVIGYNYFYTDFNFNHLDGSFINIGIWE